MKLPFTAEQFFDVFRIYNEAVWPAQIGLTLLAVAAVGLYSLPRAQSGRLISAILALLWAWTGTAYHLIYFAPINKAAFAFGAVFLAGAAAFLWAGVVRGQLAYTSASGLHRLLGWILLVYALVAYPLLSGALGHTYPETPTFGLPCPTTIFTIGMLCLLAAPFPKYVLVAPLLWSAVGSQATFLFGVYADIGLLVAGIVALYLLVEPRLTGAGHGYG
ncbi:MAG: hypothetical protein IH606_14565 [Burkholderiales bacterium]|nr:hypothetical protein [Burkholderiales bacterium]